MKVQHDRSHHVMPKPPLLLVFLQQKPLDVHIAESADCIINAFFPSLTFETKDASQGHGLQEVPPAVDTLKCPVARSLRH